jgi:hypothetical protein
MRGFSSLEGMQSNINPHVLPVRRPIAIMLNAMTREMPLSMLCIGGIPSNGIIKIIRLERRVK